MGLCRDGSWGLCVAACIIYVVVRRLVRAALSCPFGAGSPISRSCDRKWGASRHIRNRLEGIAGGQLLLSCDREATATSDRPRMPPSVICWRFQTSAAQARRCNMC